MSENSQVGFNIMSDWNANIPLNIYSAKMPLFQFPFMNASFYLWQRFFGWLHFAFLDHSLNFGTSKKKNIVSNIIVSLKIIWNPIFKMSEHFHENKSGVKNLHCIIIQKRVLQLQRIDVIFIDILLLTFDILPILILGPFWFIILDLI